LNTDELIDNGAGILGNNMFVYCTNNTVNMIDVDGYAPTYISDQGLSVKIGSKKMKDISLGIGNIAAHYIAGIGTGKGGVGGSFRFYNSGLYDEKEKVLTAEKF
jgi:hypothetical protein